MNNHFKSIDNSRIYFILFYFTVHVTVLYSCVATTKLEANLVRSRRDVGNSSCAIPAPSLDKIVTLNCDNGKQSTFCGTENNYVPEFTVASIRCKPNYHREVETRSTYICHNRTWVPEFDNCIRKCDKLQPANVDLKCSRNDKNITCEENSLLAGSKVRPTCKQFHKHHYVGPHYPEITCNADGKWDKSLFSCVPECGKPFKNPTTLISRGEKEHISDSPWHVAIYNPAKLLICGGTIITSHIVLTAAHCFEEKGTLINNTANYEIVVSKNSRDYATIDNHNQKSFKIKQIHFSTAGYHGLNNYYSGDIAALILHEELTFSPTVMPACVDWIGLNTKKFPPEGTPAKVSGWGLTEHGNYSDTLMSVNLPYISREKCIKTVSHDYKIYLTRDKFCAGAEKGPGVQKGDSGGGLLFQEDQVYFLRGIVSLKQPSSSSSSSIAAFTDLADHKDWIFTLRNAIENEITIASKNLANVSSGEEICADYGMSNCRKIYECPFASNLILTKRVINCGYDSDNTERICCSSNSLVSETSTSMIPTSNSTAIVESYCEKYSKITKDCVYDTPPIGERKKALLKEYPHIGELGCESNLQDVVWSCVGSLISEKFILSVSHCCNTGDGRVVKWAYIGHLNKATAKRNATIYAVEKHFFHPHKLYSIALYQLKTAVVMSPFIRPACLYTSEFNQVNNKLRIASWGTDEVVGSYSSHLLKSSLTVIDNQNCLIADKLFESDSMACVGNITDKEGLCLFNAGSPLLVPSVGNKSCTWTVFGIKTKAIQPPRSCTYVKNAKPIVYEKVSYFIEWIQNIVWPHK